MEREQRDAMDLMIESLPVKYELMPNAELLRPLIEVWPQETMQEATGIDAEDWQEFQDWIDGKL
jgi:hypothetical protein